MTPEQEELIQKYMMNGATLEKSVGILKQLVKVKETDEEALAIIFLLMTTTKQIIENRSEKARGKKI